MMMSLTRDSPYDSVSIQERPLLPYNKAKTISFGPFLKGKSEKRSIFDAACAAVLRKNRESRSYTRRNKAYKNIHFFLKSVHMDLRNLVSNFFLFGRITF